MTWNSMYSPTSLKLSVLKSYSFKFFGSLSLNRRHESVITKLYTGIQCYSCGMRFTASQTDIYADHLDWHYRQNRSEKDISRKITHRRWYYSLTVSPKTLRQGSLRLHSPLCSLTLGFVPNLITMFLGLDWIRRNCRSRGEGKEPVLWKSPWRGCTEKPGSSQRERIPECKSCCRCCSWSKHAY